MSDMHVSSGVEHRDDGTAIKFEVNVGGRSIVGKELLPNKEPTPGMIRKLPSGSLQISKVSLVDSYVTQS